MLNEDWSSGSFATNQWTYTEHRGTLTTVMVNLLLHWFIIMVMLLHLTILLLQVSSCKPSYAPFMTFQYDISLSNFSNAVLNSMAC